MNEREQPAQRLSWPKWYHWIIACIFTTIFCLPGIEVPYLFPMGLFEGLGIPWKGGLPLGWVIYLVIVALAFNATPRARRTLFLLFCVLLLINIVGCRMILAEFYTGLGEPQERTKETQ